jgi:hypothetical protein
MVKKYYLTLMRKLFCISLTILLSAAVRGQIFLTKEGNATSVLGIARKTLIRIAESNMDVFVPTDSALTMGFVVAREDATGKTQYEFLCVDTSLQNQITIHPNVLKDIIWKDLTDYHVSPYIIIQPFTFSGPNSPAPQPADKAAAEARLQDWLANQTHQSPIFLRPLSETIWATSCGPARADTIPKSAIPKLVMKPH